MMLYLTRVQYLHTCWYSLQGDTLDSVLVAPLEKEEDHPALKVGCKFLTVCSHGGLFYSWLRMQAGAPAGGLHAPASAYVKNLVTLQAPANAFVHLPCYLLGLRRMQSMVPQTPASACRMWRG
jgi:hypothetical protein